MFSIRRDDAQSLIVATLRDFWIVDTVDRYDAALSTEIAKAMSSNNPIGMLIDCSDFPVQSREVTQRFADAQQRWTLASQCRVFGVAMVVASVLSKKHAQRVFDPSVHFFLDRPKALAWLAMQRRLAYA